MALILQFGLIGQGASVNLSGGGGEGKEEGRRGRREKNKKKIRAIRTELRVMELTHFGTALRSPASPAPAAFWLSYIHLSVTCKACSFPCHLHTLHLADRTAQLDSQETGCHGICFL
jgi:hypothetical protein